MAHDNTLRWQGRDIAWTCTGQGRPLVFLHGTPFSAREWATYAAELATHYAVYTWDLPGYGESSQHPEHAVDFGVHASAFAALIQHWELDSPHVVAHDFGGGVALRAHLVEGIPFASLMLIDAVAVPPSGSSFFRFVTENTDVLAQLPPYIHEAVLRAYISGASHRGLTSAQLDELCAPWVGDTGQPAFYRQIADYDEVFLVENERRISDVRIPVRVLWGAEDAWLPLEVGQRLYGLISGAQWRTINNAGHLVQYDAPIELSIEIANWLAEQRT